MLSRDSIYLLFLSLIQLQLYHSKAKFTSCSNWHTQTNSGNMAELAMC